jgi:hypothetical protein
MHPSLLLVANARPDEAGSILDSTDSQRIQTLRDNLAWRESIDREGEM